VTNYEGENFFPVVVIAGHFCQAYLTLLRCKLHERLLNFGLVFSERDVRYMLSPVRLSSVCLSVTFVHPTQAVQIFGNISAALGTFTLMRCC